MKPAMPVSLSPSLPPRAGEGVVESLREFHVKEGGEGQLTEELLLRVGNVTIIGFS